MHVRGASAYAGAMLKLLDVNPQVRAVAEEVDAVHSEEPYAVIQRQRRFGELQGRFSDND